MKKTLNPQQIKRTILERTELAILDVREEGVYFDCHLFWASNIPLSLLELRIIALIPRKTVSIVVYDTSGKDNGPAFRAQIKLLELGYPEVSVLEGGVDGWRKQGFELFSGLNVPSKAFGEFLLQTRKPPEIEAKRLNDRVKGGDNLVILDSRPSDEFYEMSIPHGIDSPGAELVHRVFEVAPDPDTDVIVNCAGRTRSIVGAQSLINAGVPNRVMLLKDGTMGWHLAGLNLDSKKVEKAPWPSQLSFNKSQQAANKVAKDYDVSFISLDTLIDWRKDESRTLYLFDVRTIEEYEAGHLADAKYVAGGQLVQTTDEHIAVHNARTVLVDDRTVRAVMTASWLMQMGHRDIHVLVDGLEGSLTDHGPPVNNVAGLQEAQIIEAGELKAVMQSGESSSIIDLSSSRNFRKGHIETAIWCVRQRLDAALALIPPIGLLVLTSEDGIVAHLAANDLAKSNPRQLVRVLRGGNQSWTEEGYNFVEGMEPVLCEVDDVWDRPYDREEGQEQRMQAYLDWEVQLMDQVNRDGTAEFYC